MLFEPSLNQLRITKLLLHETGTYNTQYRRPYQTELSGQTLTVLEERLNGTTKFQPSMLAGVANQFIAPQATPEKEIAIPQGWTERRFSFMMEIEHTLAGGSRLQEVVLGYTQYKGVSRLGTVDPEMEFYVNSTLLIRKTIEHTPLGNQVYSNVVDASQILVDNNFAGIYSTQKEQHMRPEDVYSLISRNHLDLGNSVADGRTLLTSKAVKSKRANNIAANYMAGILENYKNASYTQNMGQGPQEILSQARGYAAENLAAKDPFLNAMAGMRGMPVGNVFTFRDLKRLDPNVEEQTLVSMMGEAQLATAHQAGQTQHWGGADNFTRAATILSQAVPALLMELTLTNVVFQSSNRYFGLGIAGQTPVTTSVIRAEGFSSGDLSHAIQMFQVRLEHEILRDISYDNAIDFMVEMQVDLLGETWIKVSLDGGPMIDYVVPSFCDALMVPVVTANDGQALNLSRDFDSLFDNLGGATAVDFKYGQHSSTAVSGKF